MIALGLESGDGFLRNVDRKKEILITSGGKNVAPVPIELKFKSIPGVSQAVVVGERRRHLAALLTLDPEQLPEIARRIGSTASNVIEAASCAAFRAYLEEQVARINSTLASFESIKRFAVLPGQLSVDDGTLTPILKLRRRTIDERYRVLIDSLYAEGPSQTTGIA